MSGNVRSVPKQVWLFAVILWTTLLASGCGAQSGAPNPTTSQPDFGLEAGPSTTTAEEAAVLAAYRGWWRTIVEVGRNPNPDSPRLAEHATGKRLTADRSNMARYQQQGIVLAGDIRLNPEVVELTGRRAVVRDCVESSAWFEVDKASGSTIPNRTPAPDLYTVTLVRGGNGPWKVSESAVRANTC